MTAVKRFIKPSFIVVISLALLSCRKDNTQIEDNPLTVTTALATVEIKNNRLSFSDGKSFANFLMSVNETEESPTVFEALRRKGFTSARIMRISGYGLKPYFRSTGAAIASAQAVPQTNQELVSDPLIEELLNENMEVEIQGLIYKVTAYGTFVVTGDNYPKLIDILNSHQPEGGELQNSPLYSKSVSEDLYKIDEEIYLFDTFAVNNDEAQLMGDKPIGPGDILIPGDGSGGYYPPTPPSPTTPTVPELPADNSAIENRDYSSLPLITFGAKTVVGKFLAGFFGTNEVYKGKFNDDRRVKVSLSNTNYIFVKSFGVRVQFQKKNWIGWSGTSCDELRLGWDGVEFKTKSGIPVEPQTALGTPVDYSGNPNWDTTLPPWVKPPSTYKQFDLLGYNVQINKSKTFQQAVKELYDLAQQKFGDKPRTNDKSKLVVWRNNARTHVTFIGGPEEEVQFNSEEIKKNFARSIDVVLSVPTSTSYSAILKSVLATLDASRKETQIELTGASIYGVAKYQGVWLGARIDKNDE